MTGETEDQKIPMPTTDATSSVWTTIPQNDLIDIDASSSVLKDSGIIVSDASILYGQQLLSTSTTSTTTSGSSSYYSTTSAAYPPTPAAGYSTTMYANAANPATYYQQVASNLRATAATNATFPYGLATTPTYYGAYPVDYTAYNPQYYQNIRGGYYNPLNTAAAYASVATSLTSDNSSISDVSAKEKKKAKKKKLGSCSPDDEVYVRVFIWDIDDLTMCSRNIIAQVTQQFPHLASAAINLHQLIERVVCLNFSDQNELQEGDVMNIDDAVVDESVVDGPIDNLRGLDIMRRVAPKYNSLRLFYNEISAKIDDSGFNKTDKPIINYELIERCGMSGQESDLCQSASQLQTLFNQRWQCVNRCLELVSKRSSESSVKFANVIISNEGIAYGAAQLMVSGQSPSVPIDNIYSNSKAAKLSIPVWPVKTNDNLESLFSALRNFLLGSS